MENPKPNSIKVHNTRCTGYLYHFPHFMMDSLFNEIRHDINKYDVVYRRKTLAQSIGVFAKIYEDVMGTKNIELCDKEFDDLSLNTIITPRPNNPTIQEVEKFRRVIFDRYNIETDPGFPEVVLIERGERVELMIDKELKRINWNVTTGKERREINDIERLKTFLEGKYGEKYKAVVLEKMEFKEQVKYFKNAKIVIGVHGGGLANILFCEPKTTLVEVDGGGDYGWHFLNNSCKRLNINQIKCDNTLEAIINTINNI